MNVPVLVSVGSVSASVEIDKPKSPIFTWPRESRKQFGGFDIAMQDSRGSRGVEPGDQLEDRIDGFWRLQRSARLNAVFQCAARRKLHHDNRPRPSTSSVPEM